MPQKQTPTEVVKGCYDAFLRGDINYILDTVSDDVDWQSVVGAESYVPTSGQRRGRAGVAEFFRQLKESTTFSKFDVREFIAQGNRVVALGSYAATTNTSREFPGDFVMAFTVQDGKVTHFREYVDCTPINAAFAPASARQERGVPA